MATGNVAADARPLEIERGWWCDAYRGTREQLIEAGVAADGEFPGDPGRPKRSVRYTAEGQMLAHKERAGERKDQQGFRQIEPVGRDGRFYITISLGPEQRERRRAERDRVVDARDDATKAQAELNGMLRSSEAYRLHVLEMIRSFAGSVLRNQMKPCTWHAYQLDEAAVNDILLSLDAVTEAVMDARVIYNAALHERIEAGLKARIAAADVPFQVALKKLFSPATKSLGEVQR